MSENAFSVDKVLDDLDEQLEQLRAFEAVLAEQKGYHRGFLYGLLQGAFYGGVIVACALSLAWSHLGG